MLNRPGRCGAIRDRFATIATACSPSITSPLAVRSGHRTCVAGVGVIRQRLEARADECFHDAGVGRPDEC
jgi:hypothetical protein